MKPEKQKLLDDLLEPEGQRDAVLRAGGKILRRRRHWRMAGQTLVALALITISALWIEQNRQPASKVAPPPLAESKPTTLPVKR